MIFWNRLLNIRQQKISEENVYQFLLYFDKLYDKFTDLEKKEFLNSFVEQVDIYEQEQPDGRFLKHIKFRFPVYFGGRETQELCWDNESTVETVCCLQKIWEKPKGHLLPEFLEKECPFLISFDFIYLIRAFTRNIPSIINVVNGQFRSQSGRLCKISSGQNNDGRSLCNRIWNLSGALIFWWEWSISMAMKSSGIL